MINVKDDVAFVESTEAVLALFFFNGRSSSSMEEEDERGGYFRPFMFNWNN